MANYPQLDDLVGVWKLKDVYGAKMGGYWRDGNTNALLQGGFTPGFTVEKYNFASGGNATVFGNLTVIGQSYQILFLFLILLQKVMQQTLVT